MSDSPTAGTPGPGRARTWLVIAVVGALVVAGVVVAVLALGDDGEDSQARTSPPADVFDPAPSDTDTDAGTDAGGNSDDGDRPTGTDPRIALDPVGELTLVSAVVDLAGDGPVLASTLDGLVHELDLTSGESEVVLDLSDQISFGGEQGLLGMAADPDGERLYLDYTEPGGDTRIRSWPLVEGRPEGGAGGGVMHLELGQPFGNHNGGNLVFGPDGMLWVGTGDGGAGGDTLEAAQDPTVLLGKMLRVTPDPEGGVVAPSDNPAWDGRPEVWGIGLRNPWRYSFDRQTGALWVADVGQNAVEEVTSVDPADATADGGMPNFGWDDVEGDADFEGTADPSFLAPQITYRHDEAGGCSVTGGYVYRGTAIESLAGWYLFGDYCGGWIRAVPADDPTAEPVELVADAGGAITFAELEDGELLFSTQAGLARIVAG